MKKQSPKEKAKELVHMFYTDTRSHPFEEAIMHHERKELKSIQTAKKNALLTVGEIKKVINDSQLIGIVGYWAEIEEEIKNL